jgi:hypothetical protein
VFLLGRGRAVSSTGQCHDLSSQPRDATKVGVPVGPGTDRASQDASGGGSLVVVDPKSEMSEFLTSRRAKVTPNQAGLPIYGGNRRVPGLRREEVALLAGVSVDYYTRLERGNASSASTHSVVGELTLTYETMQLGRRHRPDARRLHR